MTKLVLVYITTSDRHEAVSIATALLEERLIACANINENISSLYWWQGEIEQNKESQLIAKTQEHLVEKVIARTRSLHSYDCPCIVTLPITGGNPPFLDWVVQETTAKT